MNKYSTRIIIATITFIIGIGLVGIYIGKYFSIETSTVKEVSEQTVDNVYEEQPQEIIFAKTSAGSAIDILTKEKISFMNFRGSDGTNIEVNHFYVGDSYQQELIRFENKLKKATKVLEITPILDEQKIQIGKRALFEEKKQVKILKLFKVDEKEYFSKFEFYETVAPDLKHALAFENRKR